MSYKVKEGALFVWKRTRKSNIPDLHEKQRNFPDKMARAVFVNWKFSVSKPFRSILPKIDSLIFIVAQLKSLLHYTRKNKRVAIERGK